MKLKQDGNQFLLEWVLRMPDAEADDLLVDLVRNEMHEKLAKKRAQGRGGWFGPNCTIGDLRGMLVEHLEKGDMVDVINLAAMILARKKLFSDDLPENYPGAESAVNAFGGASDES